MYKSFKSYSSLKSLHILTGVIKGKLQTYQTGTLILPKDCDQKLLLAAGNPQDKHAVE